MDKKLLRCPHCGGEAELEFGACDYNVYQVLCQNSKCNAVAGWCDTAEEAIAAWNQRAPAAEWMPKPPEVTN